MSNAAEILVVILSVFLALFLLLGIILTVLLIKVTREIKKVTSTAQSAAEHVNKLAMNVGKFTSPALIGKMIMDHIKRARH